jgi:hypothetical protein
LTDHSGGLTLAGGAAGSHAVRNDCACTNGRCYLHQRLTLDQLTVESCWAGCLVSEAAVRHGLLILAAHSIPYSPSKKPWPGRPARHHCIAWSPRMDQTPVEHSSPEDFDQEWEWRI